MRLFQVINTYRHFYSYRTIVDSFLSSFAKITLNDREDLSLSNVYRLAIQVRCAVQVIDDGDSDDDDDDDDNQYAKEKKKIDTKLLRVIFIYLFQ